MNKSKIRVLVVDDSLLSCELIARGINADEELEVVARASDPFEARDKILEFNPDVMTCDIQMPKMQGIEFIKRLLPQYHLPVIIVSSKSNAVFDALEAGAVDFIAKPNANESVDAFINKLVRKIKIAAKTKKNIKKQNAKPENKIDIIAMGASTGGTEALFYILKTLPPNVPGIVIAQHIPPVFSRMFADRLNNQTGFTVKEAQTGDCIESGKVLVAPGHQNLKVINQEGKYKVVCINNLKSKLNTPSVNVLFESTAKAAGNKALGVILTGMGADGSKGLLQMRNNGSRTIGQDEASSVVYGMPKVAFDIGAVERQASLNKIPNVILNILK